VVFVIFVSPQDRVLLGFNAHPLKMLNRGTKQSLIEKEIQSASIVPGCVLDEHRGIRTQEMHGWLIGTRGDAAAAAILLFTVPPDGWRWRTVVLATARVGDGAHQD
jgi:hypothetical protein